jgi:hypothetical protein
MTAPKTHEAVGQDAAFEQGVELVFDELRQVGPAAASVWTKKAAACSCQVVQRDLFRR